MNNNDPQEIICRVNIYGVCKNFFEAVNLAVESIGKNNPDSVELEVLAMKWASMPEKIEIKKKLWLKIALGYLSNEKKIKELLTKKDCPLKITDILTLFSDDQNLSAYREVL